MPPHRDRFQEGSFLLVIDLSYRLWIPLRDASVSLPQSFLTLYMLYNYRCCDLQ